MSGNDNTLGLVGEIVEHVSVVRNCPITRHRDPGKGDQSGISSMLHVNVIIPTKSTHDGWHVLRSACYAVSIR